MADSDKRVGASLACSLREKRRERDEEGAAEAAAAERNRLMGAAIAVMVVLGVVAAGLAGSYVPEVRQPIHMPPRVDWKTNCEDLRERGLFIRYYRMGEAQFEKLAFGPGWREMMALHAKSLNGVFDGVVAAVDGLFIKAIAPTARDTLNVLASYSGSKSGYGINVQATCTVNYRFCSMSAIAPGSMNDWAAWCRSCLSTAVSRLPKNFYILGDAAYPIHDELLTPYPRKRLTPGEDSFNFHLSQLRVRIEQSFGMLVSAWGILWRPLSVKFEGRADLITALFHLHNFIRDEKGREVGLDEENIAWNGVRPGLRANGTLPANWANAQPSRTGECAMRASLRCRLEMDEQWRPAYNIERNESD